MSRNRPKLRRWRKDHGTLEQQNIVKQALERDQKREDKAKEIEAKTMGETMRRRREQKKRTGGKRLTKRMGRDHKKYIKHE